MAKNTEDLHGMFKKYFRKNVEMNRKETKINASLVRDVVGKILDYVHGKDSRFKKDPAKVGSFHSHTKVSKANEFDFSILFDTDMTQRWIHINQPARYTINDEEIVSSKNSLAILPLKYTLTTRDKEPYCVTEEGCLVPLKVKMHFFHLVCEAIDYWTKRSKNGIIVTVEPLSKSPAVTITVRLPDEQPEEQLDEVVLKVDMAPMINVKLPFKEWPKHGAKWPPRDKIKELEDIGVNLVTSDKLYWKLSFAICEKKLLVDMDNDGSCRRRSLRIMKSLRELVWCPGDESENSDGLNSYHLKNILFLECELFPMDRHWTMDLLGKRMIGMCEKLLKHLSEKHLPQYFNRSLNLLENKDAGALNRAARKIDIFLQFTEETLQSFI